MCVVWLIKTIHSRCIPTTTQSTAGNEDFCCEIASTFAFVQEHTPWFDAGTSIEQLRIGITDVLRGYSWKVLNDGLIYGKPKGN